MTSSTQAIRTVYVDTITCDVPNCGNSVSGDEGRGARKYAEYDGWSFVRVDIGRTTHIALDLCDCHSTPTGIMEALGNVIDQ